MLYRLSGPPQDACAEVSREGLTNRVTTASSEILQKLTVHAFKHVGNDVDSYFHVFGIRKTNNGFPNSKMQTHINRVPRFASSISAPRKIGKQAVASINSPSLPPSCATAEFEANGSVTPRNNQENLILVILISPISMRQLAHGVEKIMTKITEMIAQTAASIINTATPIPSSGVVLFSAFTVSLFSH